MKPYPLVLRAALALGLATPASAQVFNPPPAAPADNGPSNTTIVQKEEKPAQRNVLGTDLPALDPSSEVAIWDGKAWNINDNRVFSARFERYLGEPEANSEADAAYIATIREILSLLSPLNTDRDKMRRAVALLPIAAEHPQDARLCDALLNAIFRVYLSKRNQNDFDMQVKAMEEEAARLRYKGDMKAEERSLTTGTGGGGGGGGGAASRTTGGGNRRAPAGGGGQAQGGAAPAGVGTNSLEYEGIVKRLVEIEVLKKAYDAKNELAELKTKTEFQLLIGQFFMQRRFEHTIMAARFYNQLFQDGQATLNLKKGSDVSRIFGEGLGGSPTVSTIDTLANEAMSDVRRGIESFNYLVDRGELWNGFRRLQEAFAIGEYMPEVRTLPRDRKQKVQDFARAMFKLTAALEAKDFLLAQELIDGLKKTATDYDSTKFEAFVKTNTRVSDMHLAQAKLLFSQGKVDEARGEVQKAMEVWPTNPKIDDAVAPVMEQADMKNKAVTDFDRLINDRNYRAILREKEKFAAALFDDEPRKASLNQIVTNLIKIDTAIAQSRELETRAIPGAKYAAWEEIQSLVAEFPDDAELRIRAEELSRAASEFVVALQRANDLSKSGNTGSALAMLMEARRIYPDSRRAKDGINRILDRLLPADNALFDDSAGSGETTATGGDTLPARAPAGSRDPFE
jgi:tetratricopeptide (TPR) repeat protein